jgi:ribosomal protein S5
MADPLDIVAARIARIALAEVPSLGRVGPGPVLTVVRNTQTGKIHVGLNTGVAKELSDALYKAILDQHARIWKGE